MAILPPDDSPTPAASRARKLVVVACATLSVAAFFVAGHLERKRVSPLPATAVPVDGLPELSGIAWMPESGSLAGVTDEGELGQIGLDGRVLARRKLGGFDVEDLVPDPEGGGVLVLLEGSSQVVAFDAEGRRRGERSLAHLAWKSLNSGYEGLAVDPRDGALVLASESRPAAWTSFVPGSTRHGTVHVLGAESVSAILCSPDGGQVLLVSRGRGLMVASAGGCSLTPWRAIAAGRIEGAAIVPGRGLYLSVDEVPSKLLVFPGLDDWDRLVAACRGG